MLLKIINQVFHYLLFYYPVLPCQRDTSSFRQIVLFAYNWNVHCKLSMDRALIWFGVLLQLSRPDPYCINIFHRIYAKRVERLYLKYIKEL